jgi:hypothetical protein
MRQVMGVTGIVAIVAVVALFGIALTRQVYRLPDFAAGVVAIKRRPPRQVTIRSVGVAVLSGLDGALYFGVGVYLILGGLVLLSTTSGVGIWIIRRVVVGILDELGLDHPLATTSRTRLASAFY